MESVKVSFFRLPVIQKDKGNHFVYGFVIFVLFNLLLNNFVSFMITLAIALWKEMYDERKYGGFCWKDLTYTMIPAVVLIIKSYLV